MISLRVGSRSSPLRSIFGAASSKPVQIRRKAISSSVLPLNTRALFFLRRAYRNWRNWLYRIFAFTQWFFTKFLSSSESLFFSVMHVGLDSRFAIKLEGTKDSKADKRGNSSLGLILRTRCSVPEGAKRSRGSANKR